jgi:predicted amidohydrolase
MALVRVAAAQIACAPGDISANLGLHLAAIENAKREAVQLLVFPELSLTGYESEPDTARLSRPADASELRELAEAADPMVTIVGFMETNGTAPPSNACAILAGGEVSHVHRKVNLPTYGRLVEGLHYAAGSTLGLPQTPLGPTACLICADSWDPALPWLAALGGAEAFVVPTASARGAVAPGFDSRGNWMLNLRYMAMTYGAPVIMANHCRGTGDLEFWGGSVILNAHGHVVAEAGDAPELLVVDLDPADATEARGRLPTIRDTNVRLARHVLQDVLWTASRGAMSQDPDRHQQ